MTPIRTRLAAHVGRPNSAAGRNGTTPIIGAGPARPPQAGSARRRVTAARTRVRRSATGASTVE